MEDCSTVLDQSSHATPEEASLVKRVTQVVCPIWVLKLWLLREVVIQKLISQCLGRKILLT